MRASGLFFVFFPVLFCIPRGPICIFPLLSFKRWATLEEIHWRQKSRETWLREGDKNTGFFHRIENSHFRNNAFARIKINGVWLSKDLEIKEGISNAF